MGAVSWSQFGEDRLIQTLFEPEHIGFFVDVGAFNPIYFSNSYGLYRKGWHGLAIDANLQMAEPFARFRPKDTFVHSAVGSHAEFVTIRMFEMGAFNCLDRYSENVPERFRGNMQNMKVPCKPLATILSGHKIGQIDFLNVDCEGMDLEILQSNDWKRWKPRVICVEDHSDEWQCSPITQYLVGCGYSVRFRAGLSSIFSLKH